MSVFFARVLPLIAALLAQPALASATATGIQSRPASTTKPATLASADLPQASKDTVSGLYGYKSRSGAWAINPIFQSADEFSAGLAFVENPGGNGGLINTQGEMVTPNVGPAIWVSEPTLTQARFSEGLLAVRDFESNKVGFVNAQGQWAVRPRFADAFEFHEGLAAFRLSDRGHVGFIDTRGRVVIPAKFGTNFRSPPYFSEQLAAVGLNDDWPRTNLDPPGKLGYIDRFGRWLIPPKYSSGSPFINGTTRVVLGNREIVIRKPVLR